MLRVPVMEMDSSLARRWANGDCWSRSRGGRRKPVLPSLRHFVNFSTPVETGAVCEVRSSKQRWILSLRSPSPLWWANLGSIMAAKGKAGKGPNFWQWIKTIAVTITFPRPQSTTLNFLPHKCSPSISRHIFLYWCFSCILNMSRSCTSEMFSVFSCLSYKW